MSLNGWFYEDCGAGKDKYLSEHGAFHPLRLSVRSKKIGVWLCSSKFYLHINDGDEIYSIQSTVVENIHFGSDIRSDRCSHWPGSGDVFGLGSVEEGRGAARGKEQIPSEAHMLPQPNHVKLSLQIKWCWCRLLQHLPYFFHLVVQIVQWSSQYH